MAGGNKAIGFNARGMNAMPKCLTWTTEWMAVASFMERMSAREGNHLQVNEEGRKWTHQISAVWEVSKYIH